MIEHSFSGQLDLKQAQFSRIDLFRSVVLSSGGNVENFKKDQILNNIFKVTFFWRGGRVALKVYSWQRIHLLYGNFSF